MKASRTSAASSDKREVYVFILGETARYDHWAINGYKRDTSPELARIPGLLTYSDVSAPSYCTSESAPVLLTPAPTVDALVAGKKRYPGVVDVFKAADFSTLWVANEASTGTPIIDTLADRSNAYVVSGKMDEQSAATLTERLSASQAKKTFAVLHTAGSHWSYESKYPPRFNAFRPSTADLLDESREPLVNAYDNTIRYSDHVIAGVIRSLERENVVATVFYVSDHGEHLLDDSRKLRLHTFPTEHSVHVPLFVWCSEAYKQAYPEKYKALMTQVEAPIAGSNIFPTLVDIAGIDFAGLDRTQSFASPSFKPGKRLVTGLGEHLELDYDQRASWPKAAGEF